MESRRWLVGLCIGLCLVASLPSAVGHEDATNESRVFVADDPDPRAGEVPPFVSIGPRADRDTNVTLATAARIRDFEYRTTDPQFAVGVANRTLADYRTDRLAAIEFNQSTSRWPAHAPEPQDGVLVKDAYITFMGASGGQLPATTAPNGTAPYMLPRNGSVYTLLDYRLAVADETCEQRDGAQRCVSYRVLNRSVVRRLSIGNQQWTTTGRTARTIDYTDAQAEDTTTLRVSATVTVTVEQVTEVIGNSSTDPIRTDREVQTHNLTVSDSRPVAVTTNQPMAVEQRVIRTADGDRTVVLTFDAPATPSDRRLWSTATVGNATLRNVWAAYSLRRSTNATLATRNGSRSIDLPHPLAVRLTTVRDSPTLTRSDEQLTTGAYPELAATALQPTTEQPPAPGSQVNLSTAPVSVPQRIVIEDAPAPVTSLRDIHGDSIPIRTTRFDQRAAALSLTRINETHARLTLTDKASGEPLGNRSVRVVQATSDSVTTDADGTAVVQRTGSVVRAEFQGTNVSTTRSRYYGPTSARVSFPTSFSIYQAIVSLAGALVSVAGIIILLVPLHYVLNSTS
jgi:hypothetical protein